MGKCNLRAIPEALPNKRSTDDHHHNPAGPRAGRPTDVAKSSAHSGPFGESVAFRLRLRRLPSVGFVWILSHGRLRSAPVGTRSGWLLRRRSSPLSDTTMYGSLTT
jgi:hypothetical protein